MMRARRAAAFAAAFATAAACGGGEEGFAGGVLALPDVLAETSAIAPAGDGLLACVQDEAGVLFVVDLATRTVRSTRRFGGPGDYEGLARAGDLWWVLRSDGLLASYREEGERLVPVRSLLLDLPYDEFEGLCHDPYRGVLLIAPKSKPRGGKDARDARFVYAFDLAAGALLRDPVLTLDVGDVVAAAQALGIELPVKETPKGKERVVFRLLVSELCVDPANGDVLLLSAADRALLRVDRAGAVRDLRFLAEDVAPQPEGLAFLADGRLVVASEDAGGGAKLFVVPPR